MATADVKQTIETYLASVRKHLRGMNDHEVREIVEELRSHILDRASVNGEVTSGGVAAALAALGTPEHLASEYMTDSLLAQAAVTGSPVRILGSLFRWASLSIAGFLVFVGSLVGYFLGASFILCALLKPIHPQAAGLWMIPALPDTWEVSLRLGFGGVPPGGRDLLGWWIVPIGLAVGCGLVTLTTRCALWCVRQYRKSRVLPTTANAVEAR